MLTGALLASMSGPQRSFGSDTKLACPLDPWTEAKPQGTVLSAERTPVAINRELPVDSCPMPSDGRRWFSGN